jgi:hypothetical protein
MYHEEAYRCSRVGHADRYPDTHPAGQRGQRVPVQLFVRRQWLLTAAAFNQQPSDTFRLRADVMSNFVRNAASPEAGRVVNRCPQATRFSIAAVPAVGFVHSMVERPSVDGRELRLEYLQATNQPHPLRKVLDYFTAGFVILAVVFGPGVASLLFA